MQSQYLIAEQRSTCSAAAGRAQAAAASLVLALERSLLAFTLALLRPLLLGRLIRPAHIAAVPAASR